MRSNKSSSAFSKSYATAGFPDDSNCGEQMHQDGGDRMLNRFSPFDAIPEHHKMTDGRTDGRHLVTAQSGKIRFVLDFCCWP